MLCHKYIPCLSINFLFQTTIDHGCCLIPVSCFFKGGIFSRIQLYLWRASETGGLYMYTPLWLAQSHSYMYLVHVTHDSTSAARQIVRLKCVCIAQRGRFRSCEFRMNTFSNAIISATFYDLYLFFSDTRIVCRFCSCANWERVSGILFDVRGKAIAMYASCYTSLILITLFFLFCI